MFFKVYDVYAVDWLQNYMFLSWGAIGLIVNVLWIKNNFPTIKTRWKDERYYVSKLSILCFVLLNVMIPSALHSINECFGLTESTTVYGNLTSIEMKKPRKGAKFPLGHFYVNEKGYVGSFSKNVTGYKNTSFLRIRLIIKKGVLGWEWLHHESIVEGKP